LRGIEWEKASREARPMQWVDTSYAALPAAMRKVSDASTSNDRTLIRVGSTEEQHFVYESILLLQVWQNLVSPDFGEFFLRSRFERSFNNECVHEQLLSAYL
jgi:hypothetical protein